MNFILTEPQPEPIQKVKSVVSATMLIFAALVIALSVAAFVVQSYQVDGESMEPTLQDNDRLIVNKIPRSLARITKHPYIPARGDIIIFNQNGVFESGSTGQKQLIKRVMALPGERVSVVSGVITVFNQQHPNGYRPDADSNYEINRGTSAGTMDITLDSDEIFVAGDNRPNSEDSRYFGAIKADEIVGKLVFRILPADKARRF